MTVAVQAKPMRWSSARDCPRKAVLEALGVQGREPSERERRQMFRGRRIGQDYVLFLAASAQAQDRPYRVHVASGSDHWVPEDMRADTAGEAAFLAELPVEWEFGIGHADIYATETDTVIEVLSSAHYESQAEGKLIQAVGYARRIAQAKAACLVVVDPSDFAEQRMIVVRGSDEWTGLETEVERRVSEIQRWRDTGEYPARVCRKPADAVGHFCRLPEPCFEGWEPEPRPVLDTAEARAAALRFDQAKAAEKQAEAILSEAKTARMDAQADLEALDLPAGETEIGPYTVKRIDYRGRETFKLSDARKDSRIPDVLLDEFVKVGDPYSVWKISRDLDGAAVSAEDFGDEAPW